MGRNVDFIFFFAFVTQVCRGIYFVVACLKSSDEILNQEGL